MTTKTTNAQADSKAMRMTDFFASERFRRSTLLGQLRFQRQIWALKIEMRPRLKRALDIVIAGGGLVLLSPLMALVAIAIKLESPGPVFFRQKRTGKWNSTFYCLKFRSMYVDAEQRLKDLMALNEADGPVFKMRNDPRVTRVGRILRKTSIDELPQLINVLRGDMSLVGPRPALPSEVQQYTYDQLLRLDTIPGITGLQQVSGRSNIDFKRWIELDLEYISRQSLREDIKILLKTIPAVLRGSGAY